VKLPDPYERLLELRAGCRDQLQQISAAQSSLQPHPELSPLIWHVGHCFFTESLWLRRRVLGEQDARDDARAALYTPEQSSKHLRGSRAPDVDALLRETRQSEGECVDAWSRAATSGHALMQDDYLPWFIVQHYAQHLETMAMVAQQLRMGATGPDAHCGPRLTATGDQLPAWLDFAAARCRLGTQANPQAYDNELVAHDVELPPYRLGQQPVSNANWLTFMQDGGYRRPDLWDTEGWAWRRQTGIEHPLHWREASGGWTSADPADPLLAQAPVHGICWHEACAFARWAGARLPNEAELEHAARLDRLPGRGQVWEWCANALAPYPGFEAYPYAGYSQAWFDGRHRVLRGGSRHTHAELRRPGFRNFYPETHRHVFAGLRLAADA